MRFRATPNGACFDNRLAFHIYGSEDQGSDVKRRINYHIIANCQNYYDKKFHFPYVETIGTGISYDQITFKDAGEMLLFFGTNEALKMSFARKSQP